jgi:LacI family transcriptional regulator
MPSRLKKRVRVTLQAVADFAGVNRVTAAVALGQSPQGGTRVSAATRLRVVTAAQELGYAPNQLARALRGERTNIIGYYAGYEALDAHDLFTAAILQGLQQSCRRYQQDLLIFGSFQRDTVDSIYATLASGKIDGLIILPTPLSPIMDRLFDSHLPVVAIANSHPAIPSVVVDDAAGASRVAEYLAQQGHRNVIYRSNNDQRTSAVRRQQAFVAAASAYGMQVTVTHELDGHLTSAQEVALLAQPAPGRPTAVACWNDLAAYALLEHCGQLGLPVPSELAVLGFDGIPVRIPPKRVLSTICAPWVEVAAQAVDVLQTLLNGEEVAPETVLPVQFVMGDTT